MKNLLNASFNFEHATNIRNVCILRLVVGAATFAAVVWASLVNTPFNSTINILIILSLELIITVIFLALNKAGKYHSEKHFFTQLMLDVFFISLFVYSTGGATNPFVTYFLVPLSIGAATLTKRYSIVVTSFTILCYTLLLFFYQPFPFYIETDEDNIEASFQYPMAGHDHHNTITTNLEKVNHALNPHFLGMWINFLISSLLISGFILRMAQAIRDQEKAINQQHEQQIYDEQILSVATIAASTAHELGTPINSLALLVDEFSKTGNKLTKQQHEDLHLMQSQITQCSKSLKKLVATAHQTQAGQRDIISCRQLMNECLHEWQPLRPEITIKKIYLDQLADAKIRCDHSIFQAIINLLNNAANICPQYVCIDLQYTRTTVKIIISDQGGGVPAHILGQYGQKPIHDNEQKNSLGLGLFVSNASVRRHHGTLLLRNWYNEQSQQSGAEAIIALPRFIEKTSDHD